MEEKVIRCLVRKAFIKEKKIMENKLYIFELCNLTSLTPPAPTNYGIFHNFLNNKISLQICDEMTYWYACM